MTDRRPKATIAPVRLLLRTVQWGGILLGSAGILLWVGGGALGGGLSRGSLAACALGVAAFAALRLLELAQRGRRSRLLRAAALAALLAGAGWAVLAVSSAGPGRVDRVVSILLAPTASLTGLAAWALLAGLAARAVPRGTRGGRTARLAIVALGAAAAATVGYFLHEARLVPLPPIAYGEIGAVASIAAAVLLLVTWSMLRWPERAGAKARDTVAFRCPRCGAAGRLRPGGDRCPRCALGVTVRVT